MDLREWNLVASGDFSRRHPWEVARLWSLVSLLKQNGYVRESRFSVLDFGAGDLFVAFGVKSFFPYARIASIDSAYNDQLVAGLKKASGFDDISPFRSVDAWNPTNGHQADVVLLLDVLEHCKEDREVLEMLKQSGKIKNDALWVITVPAYQGLFTRYDKFLGHFRRYQFSGLSQAVRAAGLDVRTGGYFFASLVLPRMLVKTLESLGLAGKKEPKGLAGFRPRATIGKLIATILYVDFRVSTLFNRLGLRLPGLSCYVLARTAGPSRSARAA